MAEIKAEIPARRRANFFFFHKFLAKILQFLHNWSKISSFELTNNTMPISNRRKAQQSRRADEAERLRIDNEIISFIENQIAGSEDED